MTTEPQPPPPWRRYPGEDPWWSGWRQGEAEAWLLEIWLPFWRSLAEGARTEYLEKWAPPPEWKEYLQAHWR
jgi:hypothetical protein